MPRSKTCKTYLTGKHGFAELMYYVSTDLGVPSKGSITVTPAGLSATQATHSPGASLLTWLLPADGFPLFRISIYLVGTQDSNSFCSVTAVSKRELFQLFQESPHIGWLRACQPVRLR